MSMCPLCNQFTTVEFNCPNCNQKMGDQGRVIDYFDDYSPYLDIDGMKQADGYSNDYHNHQCPHLFSCNICGGDQVILMDEWLNEHDKSWE